MEGERRTIIVSTELLEKLKVDGVLELTGVFKNLDKTPGGKILITDEKNKEEATLVRFDDMGFGIGDGTLVIEI